MRFLRQAGKWISISTRLASLNVFPLATVAVLLIFVGTQQGYELVRISTREWDNWQRLGSVFAPLLFCGACIHLAVAAVLASYAPRLLLRLNRTKEQGIPTWLELGPWICGALPAVIFGASTGSLLLLSACLPWILGLALVFWRYRIAHGFSHAPLIRLRFFLTPLLCAVVGLGMWIVVSIERILGLGPLGIVLMALGGWCFLFSVVFVALPLRMHLPSLALLPVLIILCWSLVDDPNVIADIRPTSPNMQDIVCNSLRSDSFSDRAELGQHPECRTFMSLDERFLVWLESRGIDDAQDVYPVFLVAAEGGGVRAAYWTAEALSRIDEHTQGRFSNQVFAVSGVSGGSVGLLAYADLLLANNGWTNESREILRTTFRTDLLSPLVAGLLGPDAIRQLLGPVTGASNRAEIFERALMNAWRNASGSDGFDRRFVERFGNTTATRVPALFINSTNVESGRRFIFSNVQLEEDDFPSSYSAFDPRAPYNLNHLTVSQVAHTSARFTYMSPAATVRAPPSDLAGLIHRYEHSHAAAPRSVVWGRLVDGGYFENSATTTLLEVLQSLERLKSETARKVSTPAIFGHEKRMLSRAKLLEKVRFYGITLRNDPWGYDLETPRHPGEPGRLELRTRINDLEVKRASTPIRVFNDRVFAAGLTSPVEAMLATRDARGDAARKLFKQTLNAGWINAARRCVETWPAEIRIDPTERLLRCSLFAGYYFEINLAQYLHEEQGPIDPARCAGSGYGPRPALGWLLAADSAESMDCFLSPTNPDSLRQYEIIDAILKATVRRASDPDATFLPWPKESESEASQEKEPKFPQKPCAEMSGQRELDGELLGAILNGDEKQVSCLLQRGANPDAADPFKNSALIWAVDHGRESIAGLLLKRGANVDVSGEFGMTALIKAVTKRNPRLVQLLLRHKPNVNLAGNHGVTPLFAAAKFCDVEIARMLLRHGADVELKDDRGATAYQYAETSLVGPCTAVTKAIEDQRRRVGVIGKK